MPDSNRSSCSLGRRATVITTSSIYGGAEGNRTPVRNPYMNKTVLRNRQHFINSPQTETGGSAVVTPRPGRIGYMHLHHLVSFHSDKENCNTLTESSTSDVYPVSGYIVLESSRHQAAIPFAARAAEKAGWIITTVVSLSFHFCLSLEAVFYLRVLLSQNPVEPITAPYEIVKVYRFGRRRCPTTFPNPCISQTANLIGAWKGKSCSS